MNKKDKKRNLLNKIFMIWVSCKTADQTRNVYQWILDLKVLSLDEKRNLFKKIGVLK